MVQYISFTYNKFHTKHSLSSFSLRQLFSFRCQVFLLERERERVEEWERHEEELTQSKKVLLLRRQLLPVELSLRKSCCCRSLISLTAPPPLTPQHVYQNKI